MATIRGKELSVIRSECSPELKKKLTDFKKSKGETESAIIRKAVQMYMRESQQIKDYGGRL